uniref:FH2 domain-containing protein n=1 Tax=Hyaloperonospora arabidopsidis (strain Emoy2) TaxID=559515 RepID=M4C6X0_HYAAE
MEDNGNLSTFYDEINLVLQCKSVSVDSLNSEMNQLCEGHMLVKSVARVSGDAAGEDAKLAHKAFTQFADEVDDKLRGVQMSLDAMKSSKHKFEAWFEEDSRAPLDHHLKAIVHFALEVKARNALLSHK